MTPNAYLAAILADQAAAREVSLAQRSMDTKRLSAALERQKATTHALLAFELRRSRLERETAHLMGMAAE